MRKCGILYFVFLFISLTAVSSFAAEDWVPFRSGNTESYPEATVLSSTPNELILQISFPGMNTKEVTEKGIAYRALFIPGGGRTYNIGWAELPTWSRFVAVPHGAIPQVEVLQYTSQVLTGYNVYPAQEQPVDLAGSPQPPFVKDAEFYRRDEFYPDRSAFIEEPKIIRGCQVSSLILFPIQYNPTKGELRVISDVKVKISFTGGDGTFIDPRYRSPYFESLFERLLLNYSVLGPPRSTTGGKSSTGCDFLIITHPSFQAWAESLAFWKNRSGISTWVRNTTQTGTDTGSIRRYIQTAYNTWTPPPSFLLLIGDAEFIPVFYRTTHTYDGFKNGTDLYYSTVQGTDYFPDIFPGRISVDSASQAGVVMRKILQYERFPISSPATFYSNAMVAGFFQDDNHNGWEDRFFIKCSETVRNFLLTQGYGVERCYDKTSGSTPCCYYYGDALPPGLTWTGNAAQISNAINNGIFLLNHRDHGLTDGWGDPPYVVSNVNALTNGDKLPVVLSINCETGHFDNETDEAGNGTSASAVYFCEAFQRKANGGAVGIFGLTRVSWSGLNDEMCKGFYDAIWPNFDPSYPGGSSTHPINNPMYRMGPMLNFGKFWMYDKYYLTGGQGYPWGSNATETKITFEMGHWFGDPTMQIWTALPQTLSAVHPDVIYVGPSDVAVTITSEGTPVENVLVCLMNDEVYKTGYTNASGGITFSCSTTTEGSIYVTATKHNFKPYQGSMMVNAEFILGDVNKDSLITISDVVFVISYLYHGGSPPYPYAAGDVTCNGVVDLADVVFLISYLFKGGSAPTCP